VGKSALETFHLRELFSPAHVLFLETIALGVPQMMAVVEEHRVRGTLPDGSDLELAVCVVADVRNGAVSDTREYQIRLI